MNKRILLAVDVSLSPPTQRALHVASELLEQSSQDIRLVLLHVIPLPYDTSPAWGKSGRGYYHFPPTTQQRLQAEQALHRARTALQQQGIAPERIEWLQRAGIPADEIVKAARELGVDNILIGSRRVIPVAISLLMRYPLIEEDWGPKVAYPPCFYPGG